MRCDVCGRVEMARAVAGKVHRIVMDKITALGSYQTSVLGVTG